MRRNAGREKHIGSVVQQDLLIQTDILTSIYKYYRMFEIVAMQWLFTGILGDKAMVHRLMSNTSPIIYNNYNPFCKLKFSVEKFLLCSHKFWLKYPKFFSQRIG